MRESNLHLSPLINYIESVDKTKLLTKKPLALYVIFSQKCKGTQKLVLFEKRKHKDNFFLKKEQNMFS